MKTIKGLFRKNTASSTTTRVTGKVSVPTVAGIEITREWREDEDNIIHFGDQIAVRVFDGTYWQVNITDDFKVMALANHIAEWELIEIVHGDDEFVENRNRPVLYGDKIAFRFLENGSFVGADEDGMLTARVPWVKDWEKFTLLEHPKRKPLDKKARYGGWFALLAHNGKHVMFDKNESRQLIASVPHIDEWESFVFISPPPQK